MLPAIEVSGQKTAHVRTLMAWPASAGDLPHTLCKWAQQPVLGTGILILGLVFVKGRHGLSSASLRQLQLAL